METRAHTKRKMAAQHTKIYTIISPPKHIVVHNIAGNLKMFSKKMLKIMGE